MEVQLPPKGDRQLTPCPSRRRHRRCPRPGPATGRAVGVGESQPYNPKYHTHFPYSLPQKHQAARSLETTTADTKSKSCRNDRPRPRGRSNPRPRNPASSLIRTHTPLLFLHRGEGLARLMTGSTQPLRFGPSPRPPAAGARPTAARTLTSRPCRRCRRRVPSHPAPHWRNAAAGAATSEKDLHETLLYWLLPLHLTLAPTRTWKTVVADHTVRHFRPQPPENVLLKAAEAEVSRWWRSLPVRAMPAQARWLWRPVPAVPPQRGRSSLPFACPALRWLPLNDAPLLRSNLL